MLARARSVCAGLDHVSFVEADATTVSLEQGAYDVLFSRFGVMFFADPVSAFRNLRGALRAHGRLAFVCWRPLAENPWAGVPFEAVASVLGRPEPQPLDAPGPFAFGDGARVRRILESSGFSDVDVRPFDIPVRYGVSASVDEAVREIAQVGPVARLLAERSEADVSRGLAAIRTAVVPYASAGEGVVFAAATWLATARSSR
jgi:SAM-dependent methyltransferase